LNYEVLEALGQIAQEKNVNREMVIETLEIGLLSAAKKRFGLGDNVEVNIDQTSGTIEVWAIRKVVNDVDVEDPGLEISLTAAREIDPEAKLDTDLREELQFADFGRNAIQSAKQILIQRVREAEREKIYEDYQGRIGEIISGSVQQISHGDILINLGRTEAVIPLKEQIRKERYRQGDPIRAYLVNVLRTSKGPQVVLSRTHPQFVVRLFQFEVPEIYEGTIEVKAVAREPGERAKIAVFSNDARIDPVGACVGMKGSRVQAVVRELSNERIDIVPWSDDEAIFLSRALSPAVVRRVVVDRRDKKMTAIVDDDQLSLSIGKSGQNARLAAQLTGWKVDIITDTKFQDMQTEKEATFIPLSDVAGIGKVMQERLEESGIVSANDIVRLSLEILTEVPGLGEATAEKVQAAAKEVVSVKVESYREELAKQRAIEAEEKAAREAEEKAAAAKLAEEVAAQAAEEATKEAEAAAENEEASGEGEGEVGEETASTETSDDSQAAPAEDSESEGEAEAVSEPDESTEDAEHKSEDIPEPGGDGENPSESEGEAEAVSEPDESTEDAKQKSEDIPEPGGDGENLSESEGEAEPVSEPAVSPENAKQKTEDIPEPGGDGETPSDEQVEPESDGESPPAQESEGR
jgi:N utilization substance protein A